MNEIAEITNTIANGSAVALTLSIFINVYLFYRDFRRDRREDERDEKYNNLSASIVSAMIEETKSRIEANEIQKSLKASVEQNTDVTRNTGESTKELISAINMLFTHGNLKGT
jgi:hypothetical protein